MCDGQHTTCNVAVCHQHSGGLASSFERRREVGSDLHRAFIVTHASGNLADPYGGGESLPAPAHVPWEMGEGGSGRGSYYQH